MRIFFFLVFSAFFLIQCSDEPKELENLEDFSTLSKEDYPFRFEYEENPDSSGIKTLFFLFGDNKIAINAIPICKHIGKKDWDELGIPKEAIMAVGGKWNSGSSYHYILKDSTQVTVYQISSDELDGEVAAAEEIYKTNL